MTQFQGKIVQYVFNVDDPIDIRLFYRNILGMKVLKHDEFYECCSTCFCEGPLENVWSRTIFGYSREIDGFTIEVVCNRFRGTKLKENQFIAMTIRDSRILKRAELNKRPIIEKLFKSEIVSPGGHSFYILNERKREHKNPMLKITLASSNLDKTLEYWHCLLGMKIFSKKNTSVVLGYNDKGIKVKFDKVNSRVTRGSNHLRITAPIDGLLELEQTMIHNKQTVPLPLQRLKIDDSTTFTYLLLSDPDGHLIYLIDERSFADVFSPFDPTAKAALDRFIRSQKRVNEEREFSDLSILARHCYGPVCSEEGCLPERE